MLLTNNKCVYMYLVCVVYYMIKCVCVSCVEVVCVNVSCVCVVRCVFVSLISLLLTNCLVCVITYVLSSICVVFVLIHLNVYKNNVFTHL